MDQGKTLAPLDLLIAAHAVSVDAVLVTNDRAFGQVPSLRLEDWSAWPEFTPATQSHKTLAFPVLCADIPAGFP